MDNATFRLTTANTRIVVDSSSNVPERLQRQHRMIEVPTLINFGADSYRNNIDITTEEFYRRMESSSVAPTTSQPPPSFFAEAYRQAFQEGAERILVFTVSSHLSGTYNSAVQAAKEFGTERFLLWDSVSVSIGGGWQALKTAEMLASGVELSALETALKHIRDTTAIYFTTETLKYLARSGRVSNLQAGIGDLLQVKPLLQIAAGRAETLGRVRGRNKSVREILDRLVAAMNGRPARVAVAHAAAQADADALAAEARAVLDVRDELYIVDIGPAIACLAGPGTLAVAGHPIDA